ncbi:MAG: proteasome assembly chaperone 4 family protein [Nitrososphaerota archaeon]|nr:proteasome assembly chaperone 4 family protein [Candidatus Bathyarchaeota archaeon]MDW8048647.1 proteasome assembly chaperone 4 family protein [Nitrososphaerota archaeon]
MSEVRIIEEKVVEYGITFSGMLIDMKNAYIIFLCEGDYSLGTLAISVPSGGDMLGPPLSSILLGDKDKTLARILAERLAATLKRVVLVSVFLNMTDEKRAATIFWRLLEEILRRKT